MARPSRRLLIALALLVALGLSVGLPARLRHAPVPQDSRHDLLPALAAGRLALDAVDPGHPACRPLLGTGWHDAETTADGRHCAWTAAVEADLVLPVAEAGGGRLLLRALGLGGPDLPRTVALVVNGRRLPARPLPPEFGWIAFACPPGLLQRGANHVAVVADRTLRPSDRFDSPDTRELGVYVDCLLFAPDGEPAGDPDDPFERPGAPRLDRRDRLEAPLTRPAGAAVRLAWDATAAGPRDSLRVECVAAGTDSLLRDAVFPAADAGGEALVQLPFRWLAPARLRLRLTGPGGAPAAGAVSLREAWLERAYYPQNVVLIVVDTLRPDVLGCYGAPGDPTPAIDALARDGVLFATACAPAPMTGPSHAALLTSRWAAETGVLNNGGRPRGELPMLAEMLRELDYATGAAVSISPIHADFGFARGFQRYECALGYGFLAPADTVVARSLRILRGLREPFFLWSHFSEPHEPYDAHGYVTRHAELSVDGAAPLRVPTSTYSPGALELALPARPVTVTIVADHPTHIRLLDVDGLDGEPPPLDPAEPPEAPRQKWQATIGPGGARHVRLRYALNDVILNEKGLRERYGREVRAVDARVGALLDTLRARGLYEESLIVFAGDHGEALGEHGHIGHVETLYGPMIRVPLIVKPPRSAGVDPGRRREDPASLVDVLPTVLARLGRPPLAGARGRDLLAPDAADQQVALFCETHRPEAQRTLYALRDARHSLVHEPATGAWEFYDLRADPGETRNRAGRGGGRERRWRERLLATIRELGLDRPDGETPPEVDAATRRALRALGY